MSKKTTLNTTSIMLTKSMVIHRKNVNNSGVFEIYKQTVDNFSKNQWITQDAHMV